jgi:hypothetical protein
MVLVLGPTHYDVSTASTGFAGWAVDLLLTRIERGDAPEQPPVFLEVNFELVVRRSDGTPSLDAAVGSGRRS